MVPTSGWTCPELAPFVYVTPPADGILDLDFVATAPTGITLQVFTRITVASSFPVPNWVRGVRVHSSTNAREALLGSALDEKVGLMSDGWPLPWPFPWFVPNATR
jgi:hypothetical protein